MMRGRRLFSLGRRRPGDAAREAADELAFHVEQRIAHLVARGWAHDDAVREARRRLDGATRATLIERAEHHHRRMRMRQWTDDLRQDVRVAWRGLRRTPVFTVVAVLTLAIGIGGNTAIYTAVDALLLRSLPFPQPERLMDVVQASPDEGTAAWSWPKFTFLRDQQRSFGVLAVHGESQAILGGEEPERIALEEVSAGYLAALGVRVARGADFAAALDAGPGAARVALISDALWQRRFGGTTNVVGASIVIDNKPWEVAGVLPPGFHGLSGRAEVLLNVTARAPEDLEQPWSLEFGLIGRLRDGVAPASAAREVEQLGPRIYQAFPTRDGTLTTSKTPARWGATARPLDTIRVASALRRSLLVLLGAVGMVLLIACVNLASLLMSRAVTRRQEVAVRLALGGGRARLVRMFLTESLTLATLGGAAGLALALLASRGIAAFNPRETLRVQGLEGGIGVVGFESAQVDGRALAVAAGLTFLVGILFGLFPALRATRLDLVHDLKDGSRSGRGAHARTGRRALVVTEVALAVVLLVGSGLMVRSLANLLRVDPGFDPRGVLTARLAVPPGVIEPDSMPGFYTQLQEALAAIPGVREVALADCPPLNNGCNGTIMTFADRPSSATGNAMVGVHWASPNWFRTMGVPLRRGRLFGEADRLGTPKVVVINEAAARQYFAGEDPIGKRVAVYQGGFDAGAEVIGVVGDVRFGTIDSTARPDVYISHGQARRPRMMLFIQTHADAMGVAPSVRQVLRRVAPAMPVYDLRTMESRVAAAGAQARFSTGLLGAFAAVALALAVMGIYGVMSFSVVQRSHEIGVRLALGAGQRRVLSMVVGETAQLAGIGLVLGVLVALAATRVLRTMLFEVSPVDPLTYMAIACLLGATALVAGALPARRAARIDPVTSLRQG